MDHIVQAVIVDSTLYDSFGQCLTITKRRIVPFQEANHHDTAQLAAENETEMSGLPVQIQISIR
jgi:hypothetical protein